MKDILLWLWQLPQHLLALVIMLACRAEYDGRDGDVRIYMSSRMPGSISLGQYVFLKWRSDWTRSHECGHSAQSRILGPLYLVVIGIPSFCWAVWCRICDWFGRDVLYYSFYTEKWANRIAGLEE